MKVAFINHARLTLPDGERALNSISIGIWVYEMATRLATRGWDVTAYSYKAGKFRDQVTEHRGVSFVDIPTGIDDRWHSWLARAWKLFGFSKRPRRPMFASRLYYFFYAIRVAIDIRRRGCEIVHITNFSQWVPIIRLFNPGVQVVLHMQCEWGSQLDAEVMEPRLSASARITGCSHYIARKIAEKYPHVAARCEGLHNGCNLEQFQPDPERRASKPNPEVVFIGRVSPEKGLHVLFEGWPKVLERVPDVRLSIIGPQRPAEYEFIVALDDDPLVQAMERFYHGDSYFETLKAMLPPEILDKVDFIDNLPQPELQDAYSRADVFVFPSEWHEPFGMPVIETGAAGTPIVTTRGGGIPELVVHGETGFLVDRGEVDGLADAIATILEDNELRDRMGRAAREHVEENFGWDRIADALAAVFAKMEGVTVPVRPDVPSPPDQTPELVSAGSIEGAGA